MADGQTGYFLVKSSEADGRVYSIATGFMAVPHHYLGLADEMARAGWTVVIPEITTPLPDEDPTKTVAYKCDRLRMGLEDLGIRMTVEEFQSGGHSLGGVCQADLMKDAPYKLAGMDFMNTAGFGEVDNMALMALKQIIGCQLHEVPTLLRHPSHFVSIDALKAEAAVLLDKDNRRHELNEMKGLSNYLPVYVELAKSLSIPLRFLVSLHDNVVRPGPTIEAVGINNVVSIHPKADHFAPNTHGTRVAHLLNAA